MPAIGFTKSLRFADLIRVSTEKQDKKGESLHTQRKSNTRDVERLGGSIKAEYGGQEHATPGWEKAEVDRLIADAAKGKWDAVIVTYADRWSRDNAKSKEGLEAFRKHGIKFYVGTMEMDLFNPEHCLILGMHAEIGEFFALQGLKKSLESKIERARRGLPSCGTLPFGRTYDKATGQWGIDPEKQRMLLDVATRYLAGESMERLATEYDVAYSTLYGYLRDRAGLVWVQRFDSDRLNIHETVETPVPALLDPALIKRVHQRLEARNNWLHKGGREVNDYLLGGHIFCNACGCLLTGRTGERGQRYYRHPQTRLRSRPCTVQPPPWVQCDAIEKAVIGHLFNVLGNPAAILRAVHDAVPDCDEALDRQRHLTAEVAKIDKARNRMLDLVEKDALTDAQAAAKLTELKDREQVLRDELTAIAETLAAVPDEAAFRCYIEQVETVMDAAGTPGMSITVRGEDGETYAGGNDVASFLEMTEEDRRKLVAAVFSEPNADGTPAGVYVWADPTNPPRCRTKKWCFRIRARLDFELVLQGVVNCGGWSRRERPPQFVFPCRGHCRPIRACRGPCGPPFPSASELGGAPRLVFRNAGEREALSASHCARSVS